MKAVASVTLLAAFVSLSQAFYYRDVSPADFDMLLDPQKASIMVEFYAPWCGHCKQLAPEYLKLGETFERSKDVVIAQVDADKHKELGNRFNVQGFPTMKWIPKGSTFEDAEDVSVARTASALLDFVNEKTGSQKKLKGVTDNVVELSPGNFEKVTKSAEHHTLVAFVEPSQTSAVALQVWKKVADLFAEDKEVVIGTLDADKFGLIAKGQEVTTFPTYKYYGKEGVQVYEGESTVEALVAFINKLTGMDVSADDGVLPSAGKIPEIAEFVKSFVKAKTDEERASLVDTCKATVETLDAKAKDNFDFYTKIFKKIAEKGIEYLGKEKSRLTSLLDDPESLQRAQVRKFMRKLNVLEDFTEL